jgi:hypothetical protein
VRLVLVDGMEALDPQMRAEFFAQAAADDRQYLVTIVDDGPLQITTA